jgi:hypothetical protein
VVVEIEVLDLLYGDHRRRIRPLRAMSAALATIFEKSRRAQPEVPPWL